MSLTRDELLRVFVTCREKGTAVGLRIRGRKNLLITSLEDVTGENNETSITINPFTIYGERLSSNRFAIAEIEHAFSLRVSYNDPFYLYLRSLRNNIRHIREEVGLEQRPTLS